MQEEIQAPEAQSTTEQALPAPKGIGMAVAFDWGLAVQVLLIPFVFTFFSSPGSGNTPAILKSPAGLSLFFVFAVLGAAVLVFFGEMVRSGHNWARVVQLVANTLLSIDGILTLVNLFRNAGSGDFWPLITVVILLIFSPLIVWRLSRSETADWFRRVSFAQARQRHAGKWIFFIALWAIVGGILQTLTIIK